MPHVTVEYSANLEHLVDMQSVIDAVHAAALATGFVPLDGLRTRASPRSTYRIGDGHANNAFVAIAVRLGPGRSADDKHRLLAAVLDAVESTLGPNVAANAMLSAEWHEIDPNARINRNNLRPVIAARLP